MTIIVINTACDLTCSSNWLSCLMCSFPSNLDDKLQARKTNNTECPCG